MLIDAQTLQARFEAWERHLHSFVELSEPLRVGNAKPSAALFGVTVGVKDIIDVAGLPTRNGSATCQDVLPAANDATVVGMLRDAGTAILGKTVTTEYAFTDPTDCRNPHDLGRTPGGSSSGSGAAVAAGLVDVALGTQTAGSLCRPAAYCGVVGFKPSFGSVPTAGVTPLAPSFDTIGIIADTVELCERVFRVIAPLAPSFDGALADLTIASALLPTQVRPSAEMHAALIAAAGALQQSGSSVSKGQIVADIDQIVSHHRSIMNYEAAKAHGHFITEGQAGLLQPKFLAGLKAGLKISQAQADASADFLAEAKSAFWAGQSEVAILLTLAVPEGAPRIGATTGYQDWLTPWTVFGGPLISLPWGLDALGRPLSVMLAAHPGQDGKLLAMGRALEALAPPIHRPSPPLRA